MKLLRAQAVIQLAVDLDSPSDHELLRQLLQLDRLAKLEDNTAKRSHKAAKSSIGTILELIRVKFKDKDNFRRSEAESVVSQELSLSRTLTGMALRHGCEKGLLSREKKGRYKVIEQANSKIIKSGPKKQKHNLPKDFLTRLSTLENSMLYGNLLKKLERLNPDVDVASLIDRTLEPEEALDDLKKRHPELITADVECSNFESEFRDYLDSKGIISKKAQDIICAELENGGFEEEEIMKVGSLVAEIRDAAN